MYTSYALRETLKNCILVELKYYELIQRHYQRILNEDEIASF